MRIYTFLFLIVGCWSVEWEEAVNELKHTFKEFSVALNTISSIENILNTSAVDSEQFLNKTFSDSRLWNRMAKMRLSSKRFGFPDDCLEKIVDEDRFKLSFQIQIYQIQIPLRSRAVDIRERLNNISSSLEIYQGLAESKYLSCKLIKGKCLEETNEWLVSSISALSCLIYPNCSKHFIRKRSTCSIDQFRCSNGKCITVNTFCNGICDCDGCDDEPNGCVKIPSYLHVNCSIDAGNFLCNNTNCVSLRRVCDGYNDCGDWSDEDDLCRGRGCSSGCDKRGGVCLTGPDGSKCLYECPPGTFETSKGCSRNPEAPLPTLLHVLEDTPRLVIRYAARLKFLKIKSILALSQSLREFVNCRQQEFTLLSKMIDFSSVIDEEVLLEGDQEIHNRTMRAHKNSREL